MEVVFLIITLGLSLIISLSLCNTFLPKWACTTFGWHKTPERQGFDGCSFTGICPRCNKKVLQDSQGNWF